jgi:hypothetical protein
MKTLVVLLALTAMPAFAASDVTVKSARVLDGKTLVVDVVYGGGCKEHNNFHLSIGNCLESMLVQCGAEILDRTKGDFCEALVGKTVKFDLKAEGLLDAYFNGALISIDNGQGGQVGVTLPRQ